MGIPEQQKPR